MAYVAKIKSLRDFEEGLKEALVKYFEDVTFDYINDRGEASTLSIDVVYGYPEGEFKTSNYKTNPRVYFYFMDEVPDYGRDVLQVDYNVVEETDDYIKISKPSKKVNLYYAVGFKTNSNNIGSFLWTHLYTLLGDRGEISIKEVPIMFFKERSRNRDVIETSEKRLIWKEFVYRFKAELDIYGAEWVRKATEPIIILDTCEYNETDETFTINDRELLNVKEEIEEETLNAE